MRRIVSRLTSVCAPDRRRPAVRDARRSLHLARAQAVHGGEEHPGRRLTLLYLPTLPLVLRHRSPWPLKQLSMPRCPPIASVAKVQPSPATACEQVTNSPIAYTPAHARTLRL